MFTILFEASTPGVVEMTNQQFFNSIPLGYLPVVVTGNPLAIRTVRPAC